MKKSAEVKLNIYTYLSEEDRPVFIRLKRKKWTDWNFLVSGEWSESPMHQGSCRFYITHTSDRRFWAVKNVGFPQRIIAVAEVLDAPSLEAISALMLRRVKDDGGEYIHHEYEHGDIDIQQFWSLYKKPAKRISKNLIGQECDNYQDQPEKPDDVALALDIIGLSPFDLGSESYRIVSEDLKRKFEKMGRKQALRHIQKTREHLKAQALYLASLAD